MARGYLWRDGPVFALEWDGQRTSLTSSRGLEHLLVLLERPGRSVHVTALVAPPGERPSTTAADESLEGIEAGLGPVLDEEAKRSYRLRVNELEAEIDDAVEANDTERAARARVELEFLMDELRGAVGLGGRDRPQSDPAEKARQSVTKAIGRAVEAMRKAARGPADHLDRSVSRGFHCSYDPDTPLLAAGPPPTREPVASGSPGRVEDQGASHWTVAARWVPSTLAPPDLAAPSQWGEAVAAARGTFVAGDVDAAVVAVGDLGLVLDRISSSDRPDAVALGLAPGGDAAALRMAGWLAQLASPGQALTVDPDLDVGGGVGPVGEFVPPWSARADTVYALGDGPHVRPAGIGRATGFPPAARLVGRTDEISRFEESVGHGARVVTFFGPGGIGKTTLAAEIARRWARRWGRDAWFVDLTAIESGPTERPDGADDVRHVLPEVDADAGALVVLDNAEHVRSETERLLAEIHRRWPSAVCVVTSRRPVGVPGEVVIDVDPLGSEDRRRLAAAVLARHGVTADAELVAGLADLSQGVPLALELLGAASGRRGLLDVLAVGLESIAASPSSSGDGRHQGLEALSRWSTSLLDPASAQMFRALSVVHGSFGSAVADVVVGRGNGDCDEQLADLADRSLLRAEWSGSSARYTMLAPIRVHATTELDAHGERDEVMGRLAGALVALQRDRWSRPDAWVDADGQATLSVDEKTVAAIVEWLLDRGSTLDAAVVATLDTTASSRLPALPSRNPVEVHPDPAVAVQVGLALAVVRAGADRDRLDEALARARGAGDVGQWALVAREAGAWFADPLPAQQVLADADLSDFPALERGLAWVCLMSDCEVDAQLERLERLARPTTVAGSVSRVMLSMYLAARRGGSFGRVTAGITAAAEAGVPQSMVDELHVASVEAAFSSDASRGADVLAARVFPHLGRRALGLVELVEAVGYHDRPGAREILERLGDPALAGRRAAEVQAVLELWWGETAVSVEMVSRLSGADRSPMSADLLACIAAAVGRWEDAARLGGLLLRQRGDTMFRMPIPRTVRFVAASEVGSVRHRALVDRPGLVDPVELLGLQHDLVAALGAVG